MVHVLTAEGNNSQIQVNIWYHYYFHYIASFGKGYFGAKLRFFHWLHTFLTFSVGFFDRLLYQEPSQICQCRFVIIEDLGIVTCKLQCCMHSWNIYLTTKLAVVNKIGIHKISLQTIIHNTFKYYRKTRKNQNWTVVLSIFFTFFIKWNNIAVLSFSEKTASSRYVLKIWKRMIFIES